MRLRFKDTFQWLFPRGVGFGVSCSAVRGDRTVEALAHLCVLEVRRVCLLCCWIWGFGISALYISSLSFRIWESGCS